MKPTNLQLFLDYYSNHPQALRIIEICSKPDDVETYLETLREKLLDRNFPTTLISKKIDKAKRLDRKDILRRKPGKQQNDKVRGIFTHNQGNPPNPSMDKGVKKTSDQK